MITDETLNATIAENPEEAFWVGVKEKALKQIELMHHEIIINQAIVDLADKKINEAKDGK